jgi:hypothetical protein
MNHHRKKRPMKTKEFMNYGIYVDHRRSFIIALNSVIHEELLNGKSKKADLDTRRKHLQTKNSDNIKNFCRSIISKLEKAHRILIFGPSSKSKAELQNEIKQSKSMNHISEELLITDKMEKEEALWFVQKIIPYQ